MGVAGGVATLPGEGVAGGVATLPGVGVAGGVATLLLKNVVVSGTSHCEGE